ncbi:MAG: ribulose-phosphate 3-epimerase [Deltaproteobacteria bacterium]|nr:ribulose-phosphate 3-epimerase [Deltaproteobacteria bacterium]MBW2041442.1 ribulose-phosphate 3-epimerase [Deltaproteobacteria bacterium]MBW2133000.1 ribulose-phosphate 3-epimerase [Deltaproteobacteria bacterium]
MKLIAPSILSADFSRLAEEVRAVEKAGADWIHVDVMDGHFVPNITLGPLVVEALRAVTSLPIDVHLMIENPDAYIPAFVQAGADLVSVQVEACVHLNRTLHRIREAGARPGVVLNPATGLETIEWVLDAVDFVLVMSVNPGFGGQHFIENSLEKIRRLHRRITDAGLNVQIEVDGGIKEENIAEVSRAGADIFVAGSAIFQCPDYGAAIAAMKKRLLER